MAPYFCLGFSCLLHDGNTTTKQVTFDEKSATDLLQTLNEVLSAIDPQQTFDHDEPEDATITRMLSFLVMLKFPIPEQQDFRMGLATG